MKILRFLLVTFTLFLVGCEESVEVKPVVTIETKPLVEASSVVEVSEGDTKKLEASGDEVQLLDNACYSNEIYIEGEDICALEIQCIDDDSCIEWGNRIIKGLEADYGSLVHEESVATGNEGVTVLTTYNVDHSQEVIYTNQNISIEERTYHENLWSSFSWLIPEAKRKEINRFEVFDSGDTLAYVSLYDPYGKYWTLGMNQKDIELASETLVTYLHEYAHFLSLNESQVNYWVPEKRCKSLYLIESGCFYKDAYLTYFYKQFWESGGHGKLEDFYVSKYAMYSPEEDFSESFAHFVLTQTPKGDNVKEEKILFFYQFEELVQLRTEIIARTATWLIRSVI